MSTQQQRYQPLSQHDNTQDESFIDEEEDEKQPPFSEVLVQNEREVESPTITDGMDDANSHTIIMGQEREWKAIPNLDMYFSQVYQYFVEKGFWNIVTKRVMDLIKVLFFMAFTMFLSLCVDWEKLWRCNPMDCTNVVSISRAFKNIGRLHLIVFFNEFLLGAYGFYLFVKYISEIQAFAKIKTFYNSDLKISETDVQTIKWGEVVHKIVQFSKKHRLQLVRDLTAQDIVNRIMRKENYLIAFVNKGVLNLKIPLPFLRNKSVLTKSLVWNLRYIIDYLFDDQLMIRDAVIASPSKLKFQFIKLGILNFLAAPFVFLYLLIYFFFKYCAEFKNSPASIADRRWTTYALWKIREFNELPHLFAERISASYEPARGYTRQFPDYMLSLIGKTVMFISSSLIAVILVLSVLRYPVLLYTEVFGYNLLSHLAILVVVWTAAKSLAIGKESVFDPNKKMEEVVKHTHYLPDKWRGRAHHPDVRASFESMFQYHLVYFIQEMTSILITPLILCFSLPKCAETLLKFVDKITVDDAGVGHICGFAQFNFKRFGNSQYGSVTDDNKMLKSTQGKMEKSFLNFKANYPHWEPDEKFNPGSTALLNALKESFTSQSVIVRKTTDQKQLDPSQILDSKYYFHLLDSVHQLKFHRKTQMSKSMAPK